MQILHGLELENRKVTNVNVNFHIPSVFGIYCTIL